MHKNANVMNNRINNPAHPARKKRQPPPLEHEGESFIMLAKYNEFGLLFMKKAE
jgi:hypothetical protein